MRYLLLPLLLFAIPATAAQLQSAPLPAEAHGPILDLSFALNKPGIGQEDLLRFSDFSARLTEAGRTVPGDELSRYARMAARLTEAAADAGTAEPAAAAALHQVRDALAPRLAAEDLGLLDHAYRRVATEASDALLDRAEQLAAGLSQDKNDHAASGAPAASVPNLRPAVEWWTVGTRRYGTTQALVRDQVRPIGQEEVAAVYHFKRAPGPAPEAPTKREQAVSGAVGGALIGLIPGLVIAGLMAVVMAAGSILGALAGGGTSGGGSIVGGVLLAAVALGGIVGGARGYRETPVAPPDGTALGGKLSATPERVLFTADDSGRKVDLAVHAQAEPAPVIAPRAKGWEWLAGIPMMLLPTLALYLPMFGVVVTFFAALVAGSSHSSLERYGHKPGLALGAGLLFFLLAVGGAFAGGGLLADGQDANAAAVHVGYAAVGVLSLIGALWGHFVMPRIRAADAALEAEKGQWWAVAEAAAEAKASKS